MLSEEFKKFFDKASRIVERALAEDDKGIDIFVDYKGENLESIEGYVLSAFACDKRMFSISGSYFCARSHIQIE